MSSNRLPILAAEIAQAHVRCQAAGAEFVQQAVVAGQGLIEAKEALPHGAWLPWLEENLPGLSVRTAQHYMKAAEAAAKNDTVSYSSLRELITPASSTSSDWWRRFVPSEDEWRTAALVTILDELRWRPGEIADELGMPRHQVDLVLAQSLHDLPRFRPGKPRSDGHDFRHWSAIEMWGRKFDTLLGLMVEAYCHQRRSSAYSEAADLAMEAGQQDLADRFQKSAARHYFAAHGLYGDAAACGWKPTTQLIAGTIGWMIWDDRWCADGRPFYLNYFMVGGAAQSLLDVKDSPPPFDLTLPYGLYPWPDLPLSELTMDHLEPTVCDCAKARQVTIAMLEADPDVFKQVERIRA